MRTLVLFSLLVAGARKCFSDYAPANYFCPDMNRQLIVDISQMHGIWYLMEKINHTEEVRFKTRKTSCPLIHLSRYQRSTSVEKTRYETRHNNRKWLDGRWKDMHSPFLRHWHETKYLRMYWDDERDSREFLFQYTITNPGVWNTFPLDEGDPSPYGTVQVLKAVGDHLVLTFCFPNPDPPQLFTIILSREDCLDSRILKSVHALLKRQGLMVKAIEQTCNGSLAIRLQIILMTLGSLFALACQ